MTGVRVAEGVELAKFDKTGTLTSKYQAKRLAGKTGNTLVVARDTDEFIAELAPTDELGTSELSAMLPTRCGTQQRSSDRPSLEAGG